MKRIMWLALIFSLLYGLGRPADAMAETYSGRLTPVSPTYNRPSSLTTLSGVGTNVYYQSISFTVAVSGSYSMEATSFTANDSHFALYQNAFDPTLPLSNLIAINDDSGVGLLSLISNVALTASTQYYLVMSTFANLTTGDYTINFTGAGAYSGLSLYILWTRSDTGQAAHWKASPGDYSGTVAPLFSSVYVSPSGGLGSPWQATGYLSLNYVEGLLLWTRSDTGQAALWRVNPSTGARISSVWLSSSGVGAPWQATAVSYLSASEAYVLWSRSDTGQAALWRVNPSTGGFVSSVWLHSSAGIGAPWQATGYYHSSGVLGYVLWTRKDNGQAAIWRINPGTGAVSSSTYLNPTSGIGAPWQATGLNYVGPSEEGHVLWTRSDTGQAMVWKINLTTGWLLGSPFVYTTAGVGGPWQAAGISY